MQKVTINLVPYNSKITWLLYFERIFKIRHYLEDFVTHNKMDIFKLFCKLRHEKLLIHVSFCGILKLYHQ